MAHKGTYQLASLLELEQTALCVEIGVGGRANLGW